MANVEFKYHGAPDIEVRIAADFLNWGTAEMVYSDGCYRISFDLLPGSYQYKFIVSGVWVLDPLNSQNILSPFGPNSLCEVQSPPKMEDKYMEKTKKQYSVAVVATMSAGKSTLLNAMLGKEILPSRNEACTATVFRIEDCDDIPIFRGRYCTYNGEFSDWKHDICNHDLHTWNEMNPFQVELQGNLPKIGNTRSDCQIVFIDTPGPNNSMNEDHAKIAERIIGDSDLSSVIFVINASNSGVLDEWKLLHQMQQAFSAMPSPPQIIFALNKIDSFDVEKGEDIAQIVETNITALEDLGFYNPIIIPTCSELSLLIRRALAEKSKLGPKELRKEYCKRQRNNKSQKIWYYESLLSEREQKRLHALMQQFSGAKKFIDAYSLCPQARSAFRKTIRRHRKSTERARRHNKTVRRIFIENQLYSINELEKIEILSGIPLIESMMQGALDNFAEENEGVLGKFIERDSHYYAQLAKASTIKPSAVKERNVAESALSSTDVFEYTRSINVNLKYNPYFVTTELSVDGEELSDESVLLKMTKDRLSNWIDHFLPALQSAYCANKITLTFQGTVLDGADVKSAVEIFNTSHKECNIELNLKTTEDCSDKRIEKLRSLFEDGKNGPFGEIFESAEMEDAFERALDPTFEVNVIATMSSGKSTLVNSLLGVDLMPSKNEACTATIARIQDDDRMNEFVGKCFDEKGKALSKTITVSKEILEKWNDDPNTHAIDICGNIPTLKQTESCALVLIDTPGPNNSRNMEHQKTTLEAIRSKPLSMVIYVLNATQLSTNDDCWLLSQVRDAMSEGGRKAQDRFVFVANKIDAFNPEKGETVSSALNNVYKYLKDNGIENPLVIPVSAQLAKLIRLKREEIYLTRKERSDLRQFEDLFLNEPEMNMLEHCRHRLSSECTRQLDAEMAKARNAGDFDRQAELLSGVPIVEALLNDFLKKHAVPAKLKDAVDSFSSVIDRSQIAQKINEQLQRSDEELQVISQKLEAFQNDQNRLDEASEYRKKVKELQYTLSEKAKEFCEALYEKAEQLIEQLQTEMAGEKWTPGAAAKQLDAAVMRCRQFETELVVGLSDELKKEYGVIIERLRNGYQARVEKILNESFPEDSSLRELQAAGMSLPSVAEMIEFYSREERIKTGTVRVKTGSRRVKVGTEKVYVGTERVKVGEEKYVSGYKEVSDSKWYNPFSWGRTKTVAVYSWRDKYENRKKYETRDKYETQDVYEERDTYENKTFIDMRPVTKELVQKLRQFSVENIANFEAEASKNVEKAKNTLLSLMDVIDERILTIQRELTEAVASKSEKERLLSENQQKIDWYNSFKNHLQEVLAI